MYLIFSGIWLLLAVAFFVGVRLEVGGRLATLDESPVLACLAGLMALYNAVRWWSVKSSAAREWALHQAQIRERAAEEDRPRPEREPDPTFDFTDRPPGF